MTRTRPDRRSTQAFTLIEVLIAVMIFAIVLAAINGVFYGAVRLRNKTAASIEEALPVRQAVMTIKHDLANLVGPGGTLSGSLQSVNLTNGMNGQSSPNFYTSSGRVNDTAPWGDIQKVSYLLLDPTNRTDGKDLVRSVTRNLLATTQEQPAQQRLMGGVRSLTFLYYDGTQWRDSWDSTTADLTTGLTNTLPKAIKVQLSLASQPRARAGALAAPVELVVPIDVQALTNQTTQAGGGT